MALKLKADTEAAKNDVSKRSKRSLNTQNNKSTTQEISEEQKAEYQRKSEALKERFINRQKSKNESLNADQVLIVKLAIDFDQTNINLLYCIRNDDVSLYLLKFQFGLIL